jgi:hypothetical protein
MGATVGAVYAGALLAIGLTWGTNVFGTVGIRVLLWNFRFDGFCGCAWVANFARFCLILPTWDVDLLCFQQ